jgi:hypothetical protein
MTQAERQLLNLATPSNLMVNLASRVSDASTLQCAGRVATSHARLTQQPVDGDQLVVVASPGEHDGILVPGLSCTYTFTATGSVPAGTVPVAIGATIPATTSTLASTIQGQQGSVLSAAAHPTDVGVVDCTHLTPGAALTLTASGGARLVVQNNQEQLPQGAYHLYVLRRTVTAEDVGRGSIRIDTGWTTLLNGFARLYTSATDQTPDPYTGQASITSGVLTLSQGTGNGTFALGNIIELTLFGVR